MKKSFVPLSVFKQKARQIKKEKSLSWHRALDEAAIFYGFTNYKNYGNESTVYRKQREISKQELIETVGLEKRDKILKKLNLTNSLIKNLKLPFKDLLVILKTFRHSKETMRSLCENSTLKKYIELHFLKNFLEKELEDLDFEVTYLVTKEVCLKKLRYKLGEQMLYVKGEYDVILEFGFDYDPNDKNDAYNDRKISGSFELTINKNKKITIENRELGFL